MARKMKKFASGDRVTARYDRKVADIKKDYDKALRSGKDKAVAEAKYKQRMADADDDKAKWSGADRTATRAAERTAEQNLSSARRVSRAAPGTSRTSVMDAMATKNAEPIKTSTDTSSLKKPSIARPGASFKEAFAAARKSGDKTFSWNGKSFSTAVKGEGTTKQKAVSRAGTPTKKADKPVPQSGAMQQALGKAPEGRGAPITVQGRKPGTDKSSAEYNTPEARRARMGSALGSIAKAPLRAVAEYNPASLIARGIFGNAKGGAIKGYAKGGSVDGIAKRGKTRAPMRRK